MDLALPSEIFVASVPAQGDLNVLYVNVGLKDDGFITGLEGMDIDGLSLVSTGSITPSTAYMETFDVVLVGSAGTLGFLAQLTFRVLSLPQRCVALTGSGTLQPCAEAAARLLRSKLEPACVVAVPEGPAR